MSDAFVQIQDGAGKKILTREIRLMANDGTISTVEIQVNALVDKDGHFVEMNLASRLDVMIALLTEIRDTMTLRGAL